VGFPHPPASVLSVSRALDGFHPATPLRTYFVPVTLLGLTFRAFFLRGEPHLSRGQVLSCRSQHFLHRKVLAEARLQSFHSPQESVPESDRGRPLADALLAVHPSKALPIKMVRSASRPPPPMHFCRSVMPRERCSGVSTDPDLGVFSFRRRRPFWVFSPFPDRSLSGLLRFR